jgi:hypothetical protein
MACQLATGFVHSALLLPNQLDPRSGKSQRESLLTDTPGHQTHRC